MNHRLFVYGSLKRGFRHHSELAGARFVAPTRSSPGYALVRIGEYPAVVASETAARVAGELYLLDDAALERVDAFEEVPERYQRVEIEIELGGTAWCYVASPAAAVGAEHLSHESWAEPA